MKKITYPITAENFSEAWNYTSQKLTEVKRKKIIRDFLKLFANIALFFSLTLLTYGVLLSTGNEFIVKFLDSFPLLKNIWNAVGSIINQSNLNIGITLAIILGILIVPATVVSGLVTLIVWIVYNPNTKKEESGNKEADSLTLYEMSKELSARADSQKGIFSGILIVAYIFEVLCIGVLYGMFLLKENNVILHEVIFDIALSLLGTASAYIQILFNALYLLLAILLIVFILLFSIGTLLLKPFYKTKIDSNLKSALETYYYVCNPSAKENHEQEEAILKASIKIDGKYPSKKKDYTEEDLEIQNQAKEIRDRRNSERTALSKMANYEHPVYKTIKIATAVLPLVFMIASVVSFINMNSVDLYNNFGIVYIKNNTSDAEYEELKALVLKSARDFYALYSSISNKTESCLPQRRTFYGAVPRTAQEMYEHTKNVNSYYFAEINIDVDNEGTIYDCRKRGFERLEQRPNFLDNAVIEGSYDELWSLRKVMRRFLWHDRIHAKAMYRMAVKTFGAFGADNTFKFAID